MRIDAFIRVVYVCTICHCCAVTTPVSAHNGAIAYAYPAEQITVDGNLADWPADIQRHPIALDQSGNKRGSKQDLEAHFRVGYDSDSHSLYVAVEVQDESIIIDNSANVIWEQDGCSVFVDTNHLRTGSTVCQYSRTGERNHALGTDSTQEDFEVAVVRDDSKHVYEWRIHLAQKSRQGQVLGLDVAVADKDEDNSFTWAAWGPRPYKVGSPDRCGDVFLLTSNSKLGRIAGRVRWTSPAGHGETRFPNIAIESLASNDLWTSVQCDSTGSYTADLPIGNYVLRPIDSPNLRVIETDHNHETVKYEQQTKATILDVSPRILSIEEVISLFDEEVTKAVERDSGGCVMVGVFRDDQMIWSNGYGWADIENEIEASAETIGRIGSVSKPFTAVAVMQLAERGVIGLDEPVRKYFSEIEELANPPEGMKPITFRMLASHTSGLTREPQLDGAASGPIEKWEEKVLQSIPKTSFQSSPSTEHSYSNIGFGILGLAASRASNKPFMEMVNENIFEPLNMKSSTFVVRTDDMKKRLAVGYYRIEKTGKLSADVSTREHTGRGYKVPNGGIYSTVGDMAKFAAAMMGVGRAKVLSADSCEDVFTVQPPGNSYGLGFVVSESEDAQVVGHGGSVAGYNAELWFDLKTGIGVTMLRTTNYNPPTRRLLNELLQASVQAN